MATGPVRDDGLMVMGMPLWMADVSVPSLGSFAAAAGSKPADAISVPASEPWLDEAGASTATTDVTCCNAVLTVAGEICCAGTCCRTSLTSAGHPPWAWHSISDCMRPGPTVRTSLPGSTLIMSPPPNDMSPPGITDMTSSVGSCLGSKYTAVVAGAVVLQTGSCPSTGKEDADTPSVPADRACVMLPSERICAGPARHRVLGLVSVAAAAAVKRTGCVVTSVEQQHVAPAVPSSLELLASMVIKGFM